MNQRFTEKAKIALNNALEEARELGHTYVGTEHIPVSYTHLDVSKRQGQQLFSAGISAFFTKALISFSSVIISGRISTSSFLESTVTGEKLPMRPSKKRLSINVSAASSK